MILGILLKAGFDGLGGGVSKGVAWGPQRLTPGLRPLPVASLPFSFLSGLEAKPVTEPRERMRQS